jgi:hypothetical protein
MIRNLKVLGLALAAICAFGAVAASGASAFAFHSEKEKTIITAEHDPTSETLTTFGTKSSTVSTTCKKEKFAGTAAEPSVASITVHPVYEECEAKPFGEATVDTHGCDYILYAETTTSPKTPPNELETKTDSPVEVECTTGSSIKITAPGCTITVPPQGKLHGVVYTNKGSGSTRDITVDITVDKIKYTSSGLGCGLGGIKKEGEDGTLTGAATAKGWEDVAFSKDPETHTVTATEGSQVGIWWE